MPFNRGHRYDDDRFLIGEFLQFGPSEFGEKMDRCVFFPLTKFAIRRSRRPSASAFSIGHSINSAAGDRGCPALQIIQQWTAAAKERDRSA